MECSRAHIITYDVAGTDLTTGRRKRCRTSGLVTHTHQLLAGLSHVAPRLHLAVSHTGATTTEPYWLRTETGHVALAQGIATGFPDYLGDLAGSGKEPGRVRHFYEDRIDDPTNPVYRSLAGQYARVIRVAGTPFVVAQNINPIVSVLKAEELGHLAVDRAGRLTVTGVVHDTADASRRFGYVGRRLDRTAHRVELIAVSNLVRDALVHAGIPEGHVHTVPNGLDVPGFDQRLAHARDTGAFEAVRARNHLPQAGTMILLSARRVAWKGHVDLIDAVEILTRRGVTDVFVVFNGHNMVDTRDPDYEDALTRRITAAGLQDRVFLLDELSPVEVAACYDAAEIAVHPSRNPEAWGYANVEAMLGGAAVIAARHGAPMDYLEHGHSGLLVPPRDPAAIADAIQRLLADPEERTRLATRGREVAATFTVEAMAAAYHRVITGRPAAATTAS